MADPYQTRQSLLLRLREQYDEHAWEQFVAHYRHYIYAVIRRMNLDHHDALDVQQEVLLKIWKKIPEYEYRKDRSLFRSWVATVTRHAVLSFIRHRQSRARTRDAAQHEAAAEYLNAIRLPDIDVILEEEWKNHVANLAFERVEKRFVGNAVQAFKMGLDGADNYAIAKCLGVSEGTVRQLKHRVKKQLAAEIRLLREELE